MPALCHSFIELTILSGASPRWFSIGCKALSSLAGGLLIVLSLHLPGMVPSSPRLPRRSPEKDGGSRDQGQSVEPQEVRQYFRTPVITSAFCSCTEELQEPGLGAEFICRGLPHLESMVSHKPSRGISTIQSQKEQGAPMSPCISRLAGWVWASGGRMVELGKPRLSPG